MRDVTVELTPDVLTIVTAAEERPRRNLLRLLSGSCSITSGALVYRDGDSEIDLAQACARDVVAVRNRGIVCSTTMPTPHPALTCAQAVAELAQCTAADATAELAALGHGHAVGAKVGDTRGSDRSVLPIAAALLHPAPIVLVDLSNHATPEMRERVAARARRGATVLVVTDVLLDGLGEDTRAHLLTADGRLI